MNLWEFLTSPTAPWWVTVVALSGGYLVKSVESGLCRRRQADSAATADRIDRARLLSLDGLSQCLATIGLLDAASVTRNSLPWIASERYNESLKAHRKEINTAIFAISNTATQLRILGYDQIAESLTSISDDLLHVEWIGGKRSLKRNQARTERVGRDFTNLRNVVTATFRAEVLALRGWNRGSRSSSRRGLSINTGTTEMVIHRQPRAVDDPPSSTRTNACTW